MAHKTKSVDLHAQLLGLEKTLEDDILDLMGEYVKDTADSVIGGIIKDNGAYKQKEELTAFIKEIVYDVLTDMLGNTLVGNYRSGKSFKEQLFWELEKNGFVRDCPTCYFNTVKLGKINLKHKD